MLTPDELAAIAERESKATPGPWRWGSWETNFGSVEPHYITQRLSLEYLPSENDTEKPVLRDPNAFNERILEAEEQFDDQSNQLFIAHARKDIPDLLAEVERLKSLVADADKIHAQGYQKGWKEAMEEVAGGQF